MKTNYRHIGIAKLCGWFGITRQAFYQNNWNEISETLEEEIILKQVNQIRKNHRRMGTRKLYELLQDFMLEHQIKMGRDALFNLLSRNHLLVRRRKRKIHTTNSFHWLRKYPNLIKGFTPTAINQLWVSDITYWKINENKHVYISFITDAFSHKIVGYHVADNLESIETLQALKMALSDLGSESHFQLIHHSDRGVQYCQYNYIKLLQDKNIKISMTETGDPLDNSIAERINGIIKDEYLTEQSISTLSKAKQVLKQAVRLYNEERPHMSIGNLTPENVHKKNIKTEKLWKNYYLKNRILVNQFQD